MLLNFTDDAEYAAATDKFAFVTDFSYRGSHFHDTFEIGNL